VNKLLFPPLVKDKWGEQPMTLRLAALVKQVAELRQIRPLGHREKLAFEYPRLADLNREPTDGKIFILQVLLVMIYCSDLIHPLFCSALMKTEIDQLVGYLFNKDPPVPWPNSVPAPYCAENPPPLVMTITFFILHLIYD
jgi:hypothetical protein